MSANGAQTNSARGVQGVTMTGLLAKACGIALAQHPILNACECL